MRLLALRPLLALLLAPARENVALPPLALQSALDVLHPRDRRLQFRPLGHRDRGRRRRGETGFERLELVAALIVEERVGRVEFVLVDRAGQCIETRISSRLNDQLAIVKQWRTTLLVSTTCLARPTARFDVISVGLHDQPESHAPQHTRASTRDEDERAVRDDWNRMWTDGRERSRRWAG